MTAVTRKRVAPSLAELYEKLLLTNEDYDLQKQETVSMRFVQQNLELSSQLTEETGVFSLVLRMHIYHFTVFYTYKKLKFLFTDKLYINVSAKFT
jgi:hypothetical protein